MDKNFRSHPEGIFTLFQKRNEMVHIARPRTVFSVAVILLDKTFWFQSLERRVNRFLIHAALVCYESAWRKTVVGVLIAVPKQTAIHEELFRFQFEIEYLIGHDEEIFAFHFYLLMTKQKDSYLILHTNHRNTKKRTALCSLKTDAPCLTYVNQITSLYQNSCGGYQYSNRNMNARWLIA